MDVARVFEQVWVELCIATDILFDILDELTKPRSLPWKQSNEPNFYLKLGSDILIAGPIHFPSLVSDSEVAS